MLPRRVTMGTGELSGARVDAVTSQVTVIEVDGIRSVRGKMTVRWNTAWLETDLSMTARDLLRRKLSVDWRLAVKRFQWRYGGGKSAICETCESHWRSCNWNRDGHSPHSGVQDRKHNDKSRTI